MHSVFFSGWPGAEKFEIRNSEIIDETEYGLFRFNEIVHAAKTLLFI